MAAGVGVKITGLRELKRAFNAMSDDLNKKLVDELKKAGEPVASDAEGLALTRIRNMPSSPQWAEMRIHVTKSTGTVAMYPVQRGRRRRGKGLKPRLQEQMDAALDHNQAQVVRRVEGLIDRLADRQGF